MSNNIKNDGFSLLVIVMGSLICLLISALARIMVSWFTNDVFSILAISVCVFSGGVNHEILKKYITKLHLNPKKLKVIAKDRLNEFFTLFTNRFLGIGTLIIYLALIGFFIDYGLIKPYFVIVGSYSMGGLVFIVNLFLAYLLGIIVNKKWPNKVTYLHYHYGPHHL